MKFEPLFELERTGVQMEYYTNIPIVYPVHWHSAIELIYILNGNAKIMIEGKDYPLIAGEFAVIDSNQMHRFKYLRESMMIVMHFSRSSMKILCRCWRNIIFTVQKKHWKRRSLSHI